MRIAWLPVGLRDLEDQSGWIADQDPWAAITVGDAITEMNRQGAVARMGDWPSIARPGRVDGTAVMRARGRAVYEEQLLDVLLGDLSQTWRRRRRPARDPSAAQHGHHEDGLPPVAPGRPTRPRTTTPSQRAIDLANPGATAGRITSSRSMML